MDAVSMGPAKTVLHTIIKQMATNPAQSFVGLIANVEAVCMKFNIKLSFEVDIWSKSLGLEYLLFGLLVFFVSNGSFVVRIFKILELFACGRTFG